MEHGNCWQLIANSWIESQAELGVLCARLQKGSGTKWDPFEPVQLLSTFAHGSPKRAHSSRNLLKHSHSV